jgi:hypothetical protein
MNILLSLTGGYELDLFSAYTFLLGVVLFVHATVTAWHKWIIIGLTVALGLFYVIRGEVDAWSQRAFFYGMLLIIVLFMFLTRDRKSDGERTD